MPGSCKCQFQDGRGNQSTCIYRNPTTFRKQTYADIFTMGMPEQDLNLRGERCCGLQACALSHQPPPPLQPHPTPLKLQQEPMKKIVQHKPYHDEVMNFIYAENLNIHVYNNINIDI